MHADTELNAACREWRRLAEAEAEAIRTRQWTLVQDCQQALHQLQPRFSQFAAAARAEWDGPGQDRVAKENQLRAALDELIAIESRNNELLNQARQTTQQQLEALSEAGRKLRRVQRSYAPTLAPDWTSLS